MSYQSEIFLQFLENYVTYYQWKLIALNWPMVTYVKIKVKKVPGSCDSPVSKVPGSRFTVCVNLQAHATAFKATLIHKTVLS